MPGSERKVRLQRFLADAGVAARRVAEALIEQGRVEVNGQVVTRLPAFVDPDGDHVAVDGKPVRGDARRLYIMLYKPTRTLVTTADEPAMDRATVHQLVDHPSKPRLFPVGRLGYDTTGLLLLTNDGELAHRLTHPRFGIEKKYLAVVKGTPTPSALEGFSGRLKRAEKRSAVLDARARGLRAGVGLARMKRAPARTRPCIRLLRGEAGKSILEITLTEGTSGHIEDVLREIGCPVRKLTRVAMGPLLLKGLAVGEWRELTRDELKALRRAVSRRVSTPRSDAANAARAGGHHR